MKRFICLFKAFFLCLFIIPTIYAQNIKNFTLSEGERFVDKLISADISKDEALLVANELRKYMELSSLPVGWSFSVVYNEKNIPVKLIIPKDVGLELNVDLRRIKVEKRRLKVKIYEEEFFGILEPGDSVFYSIYEKTHDIKVAYQFTSIFKYRIDFHTWTRPGDYYAFICRVIEDERGRKKYDKIIVAKYVGKKVKAEAAYYKGVYYDKKGRSLVGYFLASPFSESFLRAPLRYKRISSRFSYHRKHPILGVIRPHLGVDYAAPEGTPVRVVADGKVIWKGWIGGYGRTVKVKHRGNIITQYAHLRRYAKGIRVGKWVRKGQIIGYVGHTGLATGPHLDFRIKVRGRYVNPLRFLAKYSRKYYVMKKKAKPLSREGKAVIAHLFEKLERMVAKHKSLISEEG